jgi:hypothetical protein
MAILTQAEYEERQFQDALSRGLAPSTARQKARNSSRFLYESLGEVFNTETGRAQKPGQEPPQEKSGLDITIPQNIVPETAEQEPETQKEAIFETDKFGELKITGISPTPDGTRATINTDQGDFYFYTSEYVNKGNVSSGIQFYSKAFIDPTLRQQVNDNSVRVDLQDVPNSAFNSNTARDVLGAETGILVPKDVATETVQRYTGIHRVSDEGRITGLSNGRYTLDNSGSKNVTFLYTEGDDPAAGAMYWTPGEGGMFSGIPIVGSALNEISDTFANIEDITREGIEGVDAALQNPYVRAVVKTVAAVSPDPITKAIAAGIDAYTTVDSGEDLSAGQIVNLATSVAGAYQDATDLGFDEGDLGSTIEDPSVIDQAVQAATDETVQKIAGAGASIIDGEDPLDVVVDVFSDEIIEGVANTADTAIGKEAGDAIRNNPDITNTVIDVAQGDDVSTAIANNLGDRAAEAVGADTTNEVALVKAGLTTGAGLDQGLDTDEALFEGAKTYYEEGGTIPGGDVDVEDIEVGGFSLSDLGIDLGAFPDFVGDINARFPTIPAVALSLFEGGLSIPEIEGLGIDISGVDFPTADLGIDADLEFGDVDLGIDGVNLDVGDVDLDIPEVDIEIPEVDVPEVEVEIPEVDVPEVDIEIPEVDIPEVDIEIPEVDVEKPDFEGPDIDGPDIDIDLDFNRKKGMLLDDDDSPVFELMQYAFAQGLDPLGQIRPVLPRLNNYLTNKES